MRLVRYVKGGSPNHNPRLKNTSAKILQLGLALAIFLAAILSTVLAADSPGKSRWSADLGPFGFDVEGSGSSSYPETRLAVTDHVVGVAIGNVDSSELQKAPGRPTFVPWNVILVLFDSATGKMLTKTGPWRADFGFRLFATANGSFVLQLRHYHGTDQVPSEDLHLISPSGQEIRVLTLPPAPRDPANRPYFVPPLQADARCSRGTFWTTARITSCSIPTHLQLGCLGQMAPMIHLSSHSQIRNYLPSGHLLPATLPVGTNRYTSEQWMVLGARCPLHLRLALANRIWVHTTTLRFSQTI